MTDNGLVERLRAAAAFEGLGMVYPIIDEAADALTTAEAEIARLRDIRDRRGAKIIDLTDRANALEAALTETRAALAEAVEALEPSAGCIFNDNGDITVSFRSLTYDELVAAYFARRRARSTLTKIKEAGHAD